MTTDRTGTVGPPERTAESLTGGEHVEFDDTETIFESPDDRRVEDYITGKFG